VDQFQLYDIIGEISGLITDGDLAKSGALVVFEGLPAEQTTMPFQRTNVRILSGRPLELSQCFDSHVGAVSRCAMVCSHLSLPFSVLN